MCTNIKSTIIIIHHVINTVCPVEDLLLSQLRDVPWNLLLCLFLQLLLWLLLQFLLQGSKGATPKVRILVLQWKLSEQAHFEQKRAKMDPGTNHEERSMSSWHDDKSRKGMDPLHGASSERSNAQCIGEYFTSSHARNKLLLFFSSWIDRRYQFFFSTSHHFLGQSSQRRNTSLCWVYSFCSHGHSWSNANDSLPLESGTSSISCEMVLARPIVGWMHTGACSCTGRTASASAWAHYTQATSSIQQTASSTSLWC